jgi:hypothetical protein
MRANDGAACDLFITLVHGTWPRNWWRDAVLTRFYGKWPSSVLPKWLWFADGSEFRNRLTAALSKRGLSAQMSPFLWSGANSVRERDKAAHELVEHIRAKQSDYPTSIQVVIAHSHGGNVALRALDRLGVARDKIFIATIATPFVEILPAKLPPTEMRRRFIMLIAIMVGIQVLWPLNNNLVFVLWLLLAFSLGLPLGAFESTIGKYTIKVDELVGLTSLSSSVRNHPILVLRAVDDEASLALGAAAIGNRLSRLLATWWLRIWLLLCLLLIALILVDIFFGNIKWYSFWLSSAADRFAHLDPLYRNWVYMPIVWGVFVLLALAFVPVACKSAYGWELLLNSEGCVINSQSAPDSIGRQSEFQSASEWTAGTWGMVVTLHQAEARRGLRHGLYNDPQCAERIAGWLKSELASRGT